MKRLDIAVKANCVPCAKRPHIISLLEFIYTKLIYLSVLFILELARI